MTLTFRVDQTDYSEPLIQYVDTIDLHNPANPVSVKLEDNGVFTMANGEKLRHDWILDELKEHNIKHTQKGHFLKVITLWNIFNMKLETLSTSPFVTLSQDSSCKIPF